MDQVKSLQGKVPGQTIQNSMEFSARMGDFIDSYQILYTRIIECSKDINDRSMALAATMHDMHTHIQQITELNRITGCTDQQELYAWMSKMMAGTGNFVAQQGELFQKFLGSHLK